MLSFKNVKILIFLSQTDQLGKSNFKLVFLPQKMTSNASFAKLPWPGEYKFVQVTTKGLWNWCFRLFDEIFPRDTAKKNIKTWISVFVKNARNSLVARFFFKNELVVSLVWRNFSSRYCNNSKKYFCFRFKTNVYECLWSTRRFHDFLWKKVCKLWKETLELVFSLLCQNLSLRYCNNKKEIELVFSSKQDWPHARKCSRGLQLLSFIAQENPQRLGYDFYFFELTNFAS